MIIAKPVLKNEFWILQKDQEKIGNIESRNNLVTITIGNRKFHAKNIQSLRKNDIVFEKIAIKKSSSSTQVYGYPTGCHAFNPMWDVKKKIPLFTKRKKSRCWFAAGWYLIKQKDIWRVIQNPKLIAVKRYQYCGPFYDQTTVEEKFLTLNKEQNAECI
jgi:hypothetical protein